MVSEAPRGRYDLDKPENITDRYRQSNWTTWKNRVIRISWKPLEPGLKLKIQLLAEFCHPSCDTKFADSCEKSMFQTNNTKELKTQDAECQGLDVMVNMAAAAAERQHRGQKETRFPPLKFLGCYSMHEPSCVRPGIQSEDQNQFFTFKVRTFWQSEVKISVFALWLCALSSLFHNMGVGGYGRNPLFVRTRHVQRCVKKCPYFECRDEHTIHTSVYCVLTLNAGTGGCVYILCDTILHVNCSYPAQIVA